VSAARRGARLDGARRVGVVPLQHLSRVRVGRVEAEVRQDRVDLAVVELAGAVAVETVEGLEDVLGDVLARLRLVWCAWWWWGWWWVVMRCDACEG